jgi:hypothetical protein
MADLTATADIAAGLYKVNAESRAEWDPNQTNGDTGVDFTSSLFLVAPKVTNSGNANPKMYHFADNAE